MKVEDRLTRIIAKIPYYIEIDTKDEHVINFIFKKIHIKSTLNIIKYVRPVNISLLYDRIFRCINLGSAITLEKMILQYGEELGKIKYKLLKEKMGFTLEKCIIKYGEELGKIKWNDYVEKQAYSNSYEYKNKKHGWSIEQYNKYNKSRSVTLDNMIERHGKELGETKWNNYVKRQAYTNTKDHLKEKYYEVNSKKRLTLTNFIRKYGDITGPEKYKKYIETHSSGYSKISQELFHTLSVTPTFKNKKIYYAEHNGEYGIMDKNSGTFRKYDFVCSELKIVIEFHGDHYHGNPKIYFPEQKLRGRGQSLIMAKTAWGKDEYKKLLIEKERGFKVIVVWESDYNSNKEQTVNRIIDYVNKNHR